jgi:polysaccharide biosynthesis protein PslG
MDCGSRRLAVAFAVVLLAALWTSPSADAAPRAAERAGRASAVVQVKKRSSRPRWGWRAAAGSARKLFGFSDNAVRARLISASDDAALALRGGANAARLMFDWRWAEPYRDSYRLQAYDEIYRELLGRGIRPLIVPMFAPSWALEVPCDQWRADCRLPPARAQLDQWGEVVALLARRYPRAAGIEVWNEPNEADFWGSGPDPARYTELLRTAHTAVNAVNPSMPVLGGAVSNRQVAEETSLPMRRFLTGMYEAGARNYMDAISFHPHPWSPTDALVMKTVRQVREVRGAFGDGARPLWVTEIGLSTSGPPALRFTEAEQRRGLVAFYRALMAMPDVRAFFVHQLMPPRYDSDVSREPGYALTRSDGSLKPAFCALAAERGVACGGRP